jgi:hypothetical protein
MALRKAVFDRQILFVNPQRAAPAGGTQRG